MHALLHGLMMAAAPLLAGADAGAGAGTEAGPSSVPPPSPPPPTLPVPGTGEWRESARQAGEADEDGPAEPAPGYSQLMQRCWRLRPEERPSAAELVRELEAMREVVAASAAAVAAAAAAASARQTADAA